MKDPRIAARVHRLRENQTVEPAAVLHGSARERSALDSKLDAAYMLVAFRGGRGTPLIVIAGFLTLWCVAVCTARILLWCVLRMRVSALKLLA